LCMIILLELLLIAIGLVVVALLVRKTLADSHRLDDGIEEYRKDKEANGPGNPYADLAKLLEETSKEKKVRGQ
jgi:hypothetical protein